MHFAVTSAATLSHCCAGRAGQGLPGAFGLELVEAFRRLLEAFSVPVFYLQIPRIDTRLG